MPGPCLTYDLHCHLYGTFPWQILWNKGNQAGSRNLLHAKFSWFAEEYEKVFQKKPTWEDYWPSGGMKLRQDYRIHAVLPNFAAFQAKFNLGIALLPPDTLGPEEWDQLAAAEIKQGLQYVEYRVFLPPQYQEAKWAELLTYYSQECLRLENKHQGSFRPRLAVSLQRNPEILARQYRVIQDWRSCQSKKLTEVLVGIDFCGFEEGDALEDKRDWLCQRKDLKVFLHVGETSERRDPLIGARLVYQALQEFKVDRVGHGLALWVDPKMFRGRKLINAYPNQVQRQVAWLDQNRKQLKNCGLRFQSEDYAQAFNSKTYDTYEELHVEMIRDFQDILLNMLQKSPSPGAVEICPSSNLLIGGVGSAEFYTVKRLLQAELQICVGRDDPGLLENSFSTEEGILKHCGLSHQEILALAETTRQLGA